MAVIGVFAGPVSTACASFSLDLSGPSALTVGKATLLQATGTVPASEVRFPHFFSLDAIPASVMTSCPAERWAAVQVAQGSGGSVVILGQSEHPDPTGTFTIPIAVTPSAPGEVLLCAYTDDGETRTLAADSMLVSIGSAPATGMRAIRAEALAAVRSCRALLAPSQSGGCLRRAFRHAESRCRALAGRRARAACKRSIRRLRSTTSP